MHAKFAIPCCLIMLIGIFACQKSNSQPSEDDSARSVMVGVTNYPLYFFAQQIAGDTVDIIYPVPREVDPDKWRPDDASVRMLQKVDALMINGAGYESWLKLTTIPDGKIVDTSAKIRSRLIPLDDRLVHQHGPEGKQSFGEMADHIWLDPQLAAQQASVIRDWLVSQIPQHQRAIDANYERLVDEFRKLDKRLDSRDAADRVTILVAENVYQYVARRANLQTIHVPLDSDSVNRAGGWSKLAEQIDKHQSKLILFLQPPSAETAQKLQSLGIQPIVFDSVAGQPESGDWLSIMNQNVESLLKLLEP